MKIRQCKVKQIDPDLRLAIGSMRDIATTEDGRAFLVDRLSFLPVVDGHSISVHHDIDRVSSLLLEMCIRKAIAIRDTVGNVTDDFYGWNYVQYRAISLMSGEHAEDFMNKLWYGVEKLLNHVFINIPYYALRQVHYSVRTREIVFVGDYKNATNQYVEFINHGGDETIVNKAYHYTKSKW